MESDIYYVNFEKRDTKGTTGPPTPSRYQIEGKAGKCKGGRCLGLMTVCLGLICVLLLADSSTAILQYIMSTADRDLLKTYKNTIEEFNHTISRLQDSYTDLMNERKQLQNNFSSLSQKKLELETRVKSLSDDLKKAYKKGNKWGSGWFFISNESETWFESRQYCRDRGADLIIINTEEKESFLSAELKDRVWIGLTDFEIEGNMKWVDNSPLNQGFWYESNPDDYQGKEDCVELVPPKGWNDIPCTDMRKCICEK